MDAPGRRRVIANAAFPHEKSRRARGKRRRRSHWLQPPAFIATCLTDLEHRSGDPLPRGAPGAFGRGCKWIHGDPQSRKWRQCGRPRLKRSSYCPHHYERTIRVRTLAEGGPANEESVE
jgi:hypothetical protein